MVSAAAVPTLVAVFPPHFAVLPGSSGELGPTNRRKTLRGSPMFQWSASQSPDSGSVSK
jgi:hypothetical protein